jgi:putative holliday junction resolvase
MQKRILAVDLGMKNIGIALTDPDRVLARPFLVIPHVSLQKDCKRIANLARENEVGIILIGQALGGDGEETAQSRHAKKVADALIEQFGGDVILWDESGSTAAARKTLIILGEKRNRRSGHVDAEAAAEILQSYINAIL